MTTSVLLNQVGELNDYDLQVLSDYAVEAPQPWRNALERLVKAQKRDWYERDYETKYDELKAERKQAIEKLHELLLDLNHLSIDLQNVVDLATADPALTLTKSIQLVGKAIDKAEEALGALQPDAAKPEEPKKEGTP